MSGFPDSGSAGLLAADLERAGFTVDQVSALLGPAATGALARDEPVPSLVALGGVESPLATLVRCFMLGQTVSVAEIDLALPHLGADGTIRAGLLGLSGPQPNSAPIYRPDMALRALVDLQPHQVDGRDLWFASDPSELATGQPLRADHVLGVGEASTSLLRAMVPVTPDMRVLDMGTGCGIQAIHAALAGATVTATDLSERAIGFAGFNAALNGVNLDLRVGSLLEPVAGEYFDLVISNPPFVITPRDESVELFEYRDGGRSGDDLVRDLVISMGAVLAPGGICQMLGNWEVRRSEHWSDRVGAWLTESALDGWVVQRDLIDPTQYAELWLRDGGLTRDREPDGWAQSYRTWLMDFAGRDVEAIGMGLLTLRRPVTGAATLHRVEELTGPIGGGLGVQIAATLNAWDRVGRSSYLPDDALSRLHLVVAPDVTEERHLIPGEADPRLISLHQGSGYGRSVQVSTAVAGLVGTCDGEIAVGVIIQALAVLLDGPADDLVAEVLPVVRELLIDGFLTLPDRQVR